MCLDNDDIMEIEQIFETWYEKNKKVMNEEKNAFLNKIDSILDTCNCLSEKVEKDK